MRYLADGTPIPSHISTEGRRSDEHRTMFGLFRGVVLEAIYPDDPRNTNKDRMEYTVKVRGQTYSNVSMMRVDGGGVYNYSERVAKGVEKSYTGDVKTGTYDENLDGEIVYVLFLEGYVNVPVIVGFAQHPKQGSYKKLKKSDGLLDVEEFNGIEFSIDKDSNYLVKHVGRKDANGKVLNQPAVGSQVKIHGNGDIELNTHGTSGTADLQMKLTKASKKAEIYAQNNKLVYDSAGILFQDKNGNKIEMKSAGITENVAGSWNITVSGSTTINTSGNTVVNAAQIQLNGSAGDVLTTTTDPFIDLITGAPTVGVPTVKAG